MSLGEAMSPNAGGDESGLEIAGGRPVGEEGPDGYAQFFRDHYRHLVAVALNTGLETGEAENVVGDTLEEMLRRWDEVEKPLAYARRSVVNNAVKFIKRENRRLDLTVKGDHLARAAGTDPELTVWEDREWTANLLVCLPAAQREVMEWMLEGLRPMEIAEQLGKTPATVRKLRQLARDRLRLRLEELAAEATDRPATPSAGKDEG